MCKFESVQKESETQSADSFKACSKPELLMVQEKIFRRNPTSLLVNGHCTFSATNERYISTPGLVTMLM